MPRIGEHNAPDSVKDPNKGDPDPTPNGKGGGGGGYNIAPGVSDFTQGVSQGASQSYGGSPSSYGAKPSKPKPSKPYSAFGQSAKSVAKATKLASKPNKLSRVTAANQYEQAQSEKIATTSYLFDKSGKVKTEKVEQPQLKPNKTQADLNKASARLEHKMRTVVKPQVPKEKYPEVKQLLRQRLNTKFYRFDKSGKVKTEKVEQPKLRISPEKYVKKIERMEQKRHDIAQGKNGEPNRVTGPTRYGPNTAKEQQWKWRKKVVNNILKKNGQPSLQAIASRTKRESKRAPKVFGNSELGLAPKIAKRETVTPSALLKNIDMDALTPDERDVVTAALTAPDMGSFPDTLKKVKEPGWLAKGIEGALTYLGGGDGETNTTMITPQGFFSGPGNVGELTGAADSALRAFDTSWSQYNRRLLGSLAKGAAPTVDKFNENGNVSMASFLPGDQDVAQTAVKAANTIIKDEDFSPLHWTLEAMLRPVAGVENVVAHITNDLGITKIKHLPKPDQAIIHGWNEKNAITGAKLLRHAFPEVADAPQLGFVADLILDPLMYVGAGGVVSRSSTKAATLTEAIARRNPDLLDTATTRILAEEARDTGNFDKLLPHLEAVAKEHKIKPISYVRNPITRYQIKRGAERNKGPFAPEYGVDRTEQGNVIAQAQRQTANAPRTTRNPALARNQVRGENEQQIRMTGTETAGKGTASENVGVQMLRSAAQTRRYEPGVEFRLMTPLGRRIGGVKLPWSHRYTNMPKWMARTAILGKGELDTIMKQRLATAMREDEGAMALAGDIRRLDDQIAEVERVRNPSTYTEDMRRLLTQRNAAQEKMDALRSVLSENLPRRFGIRPEEYIPRINQRKATHELYQRLGTVARNSEQQIQKHMKNAGVQALNREEMARVSLYQWDLQDHGESLFFGEGRPLGPLTEKEQHVVDTLRPIYDQLGASDVTAGLLHELVDKYTYRLAHKTGKVEGTEADYGASILENLTMGMSIGSKPSFSRARAAVEMGSLADPNMVTKIIELAGGGKIAAGEARDLAEAWYQSGRHHMTMEEFMRSSQRGIIPKNLEDLTPAQKDMLEHQGLMLRRDPESGELFIEKIKVDNPNGLDLFNDDLTLRSELDAETRGQIKPDLASNASKLDLFHSAKISEQRYTDIIDAMPEGSMRDDLIAQREQVRQEIDALGLHAKDLLVDPTSPAEANAAARQRAIAAEHLGTAEARVEELAARRGDVESQLDEIERLLGDASGRAASPPGVKEYFDQIEKELEKSYAAEAGWQQATEIRDAVEGELARLNEMYDRVRDVYTRSVIQMQRSGKTVKRPPKYPNPAESPKLRKARARETAREAKYGTPQETPLNWVKVEKGHYKLGDYIVQKDGKMWVLSHKDGRIISEHPTYKAARADAEPRARADRTTAKQEAGQVASDVRQEKGATQVYGMPEGILPQDLRPGSAYLEAKSDIEATLGPIANRIQELEELRDAAIIRRENYLADFGAMPVKSLEEMRLAALSGLRPKLTMPPDPALLEIKELKQRRAVLRRRHTILGKQEKAAKRSLKGYKGQLGMRDKVALQAEDAYKKAVAANSQLSDFQRDGQKWMGRWKLGTFADEEGIYKNIGTEDKPYYQLGEYSVDPREQRYAPHSTLPDTRQPNLSYDIDPGRSLAVRARVSATKQSYAAQWKALDRIHGKDRAQVVGGYAFLKNGDAIHMDMLKPKYHKGKIVGYFELRPETGDHLFHKVTDLHMPDGMVGLAPNRSTGVPTIYLDPQTGREYVHLGSSELQDHPLVQELVQSVGHRYWPTDVLEDMVAVQIRAEGEDLASLSGAAIFDQGMDSSWRRVMSDIRFGVTQYFPAYHFRNMWSDLLKSLQADSGIIFHPLMAMRYGALAWRRTGNITVKFPGLKVALKPEEALFVMDQFGMTSSQHLAEFAHLSNPNQKRPQTKYKVMTLGMGPKGPGGRSIIEIGARREDMVRFMTFAQRMRRNGGDVADATWYSIKHHFDYADLNANERKNIRNAFLFYTWYRKNIPLQLMEIASRPGFFAAIATLYSGAARGETPLNLPFNKLPVVGKYLPDTTGAVPNEGLIPTYLTDQLGAITINWNGSPAAFSFGAPWVDLQMIANIPTDPLSVGHELTSMLNPIIPLGLGMFYQTDPITGADLYKNAKAPLPVDWLAGLFGKELPKDKYGNPVMPQAVASILNATPFFGRASKYVTPNTSVTDQGSLGSQFGAAKIATSWGLGVNSYIGPNVDSPDHVREAWIKLLKSLSGEAHADAELYYNMPTDYREEMSDKWNKEHFIRDVEGFGIPKHIVQSTPDTPAYLGKEALQRKRQNKLGPKRPVKARAEKREAEGLPTQKDKRQKKNEPIFDFNDSDSGYDFGFLKKNKDSTTSSTKGEKELGQTGSYDFGGKDKKDKPAPEEVSKPEPWDPRRPYESDAQFQRRKDAYWHRMHRYNDYQDEKQAWKAKQEGSESRSKGLGSSGGGVALGRTPFARSVPARNAPGASRGKNQNPAILVQLSIPNGASKKQAAALMKANIAFYDLWAAQDKTQEQTINEAGAKGLPTNYKDLATALTKAWAKAHPSGGVPDFVPAKWQAPVADAATKYDVPVDWFASLIKAESNYDDEVIYGSRDSSKGAQGIAQIMPDTAIGWGVDPLDPKAALDAAAKNLRNYYDSTGSWDGAAAAYNAGPGAWETAMTEYPETVEYIRKINEYMKSATPTAGTTKKATPIPKALKYAGRKAFGKEGLQLLKEGGKIVNMKDAPKATKLQTAELLDEGDHIHFASEDPISMMLVVKHAQDIGLLQPDRGENPAYDVIDDPAHLDANESYHNWTEAIPNTPYAKRLMKQTGASGGKMGQAIDMAGDPALQAEMKAWIEQHQTTEVDPYAGAVKIKGTDFGIIPPAPPPSSATTTGTTSGTTYNVGAPAPTTGSGAVNGQSGPGMKTLRGGVKQRVGPKFSRFSTRLEDFPGVTAAEYYGLVDTSQDQPLTYGFQGPVETPEIQQQVEAMIDSQIESRYGL